MRDLLLGREPADYDVTTDATPEQVMRIFPETYAVGAQFGVVLVPLSKDLAADPRASEVPSNGKSALKSPPSAPTSYSDGRHPDEVRFSKDRPREDVQRRISRSTGC